MSSLYQPGELADMQAEALAGMSDTAYIFTPAGGQTETGGVSLGTVRTGPFECQLCSGRRVPDEKFAGSAQTSEGPVVIKFPVGTVIAANCTIQIISNNHQFEVRGVMDDRPDAIQVVVYATKLQ